ncbi:hypothetical protein [Streptomyces misionensis]|uniref:hypothetical protein n=1 Tax=Streptomyces misionensis TaxID=67331 RepID=UPI00396B8457
MADLDIVGSAGVDIVPVVPQFHDRLKSAVLPAADRVGEDIGQRLGAAISRHITVDLPDAVSAGGRRARVVASREGDQVGGALGRAVKAKLEEALRSLPKANVRLGDTGVNADIDRLRARIQALSNKTIGIDLDEGEARLKIAEIDAALARLANDNPSVQVRTDTAAARAALAAVQAQINEVDRDDVKIKVRADTGEATSALFQLGVALGGVAALPAIPILAAGIGSIASAAVAAGAGVGALALVAIPALKNITSVMQAKTAADKEAAKATDNSAASNVRAAQNALQMAGAQAQLASAHRQASQAIAQANQQVAQAERSLTQAQQSARDAQEALTQARKDAADQLAALDDKLADGALSQRDAALRVKQAEEDLNKVKMDPTATELQRQQAQLTLDQALQAQKEQSESYKKLQKDAEAQKKAGVDGSDAVKQAKKNLADANQKVADQEKAIADARAKVRDAEIQGAEQVASAERSLQSARLSGIDTTSKSTTAVDTYRQALAKLTPEQRKLLDSIAGPTGLTAAFKAWSTSLQPAVLPLFTRGVDGAKGALPGLTPLVRSAADAIKNLMDRASKQLKTPFWQGLKRDIETSAKPAIIGLGVAFGNIFKGMAGVVDGFLPHMDGISSTLQRVTGRFANWGTHLKGSPAFENFLKFASEKGPLLASTIAQIAGAFLAIGQALAPISGPLLTVIGGLAGALGSIASTLPWLVQLIYAVYVATKLWTIAQVAFNLVMEANPIVLLVTAVVALVAAVIYAYKKWAWFHDAVNAVWAGIKIGANAVVDWFKGPFKKFFTETIPNIFHSVINWVKKNWPWILGALTGPIGLAVVAIIKYWDDIKSGMGSAWSWIKSHVLYPIRDFFTQKIPGWGTSLKNHIVGAFQDMEGGIKSAWAMIKDATKSPINFVIKTVWNEGIVPMWKKVGGWIPGLPKLNTLPLLAQGGTIPAQPGVFNRPTAIVGEGNPNHPEYVIPTDPRYRSRAFALWQEAGGQLMADGGILGDAWNGVKHLGSKVGGLFSSATQFLAHPGKALDSLLTKLVKPLSDIKNSGWGKLALGIPKSVFDGLKDLVTGGGLGGGSANVDIGGSGVKRWTDVVHAALKLVGQPLSYTDIPWCCGFDGCARCRRTGTVRCPDCTEGPDVPVIQW